MQAHVDNRWHSVKQIVFRFAFCYLFIYCFSLLFVIVQYIPGIGDLFNEQYYTFWEFITTWVGEHILGIEYDFPVSGSGSGDQTYNWIQGFCFLFIAVVATFIWSLLDRKRNNYNRLHQWLTLGVRFILGALLIIYGAVKVIPVQMSPPSLINKLTPYGDLSSFRVLWLFMGSSPTYTIITGLVELSSGILLFFRRTKLLGALIALVATTHVFLLNLFYDVPVKLLSFHMLMMTVFLLAPHWRRLINVILLNRRTEPYKKRKSLFSDASGKTEHFWVLKFYL